MPKYAGLKDKTVIVKATFPPSPIVGKIVEVEEEGIWIETDILGLKSSHQLQPQWEGIQEAAAKMENSVTFIPLSQIQWLLTAAF